MLDALRAYLPVIVIVVGTIACFLLVAILLEVNASRESQIALLYEQRALREQHLTELQSLRETISYISSKQSAALDDLHAVAAHFVPRLRTERDIKEEHDFSEDVAHDYDAESRFHKKLREESSATVKSTSNDDAG